MIQKYSWYDAFGGKPMEELPLNEYEAIMAVRQVVHEREEELQEKDRLQHG